MNVLITGGAGFIGSHLASRLVIEGESVRILDNFSSGSSTNLAQYLADIDIHVGDLRDFDAVRRALNGIDSVFHLAAIASVPRSIINPSETFETNVTGTLNLLRGAMDAQCRRVIFSSSSSVYGDVGSKAILESQPPAPQSPYALSKLHGEHLCRMYSNLYGLETISLRYFNVFGPGQSLMSEYASVIPRFINAINTNQVPIIYGDGQQTRDFVYIDDVITANRLANDVPATRLETVNIASGTTTTIQGLLSILAELLGRDVKNTFAPERAGDIRHSRANIGAARRSLGFEPRVRLKDGLARVISANEPSCASFSIMTPCSS